MRYIKFTCSNGYCGCDEDFYEKFEDNATDHEIDTMGYEILENSYSFYDDDRFIELEDYAEEYGEDAYSVAMDDYHMDCDIYWEEITQEDYEECATDC